VTTYAGRRVLVLGGRGFIGANLVTRLAEAGARISIVTPRYSRAEDEGREPQPGGVTVYEGDIRDGELMKTAVAGQEIVFHMAARSGAERSMEDPWTDLDVNCRGTLSLLEALRRINPAAKVVFAGSRLQYGRPRTLPVSEDDEGQPMCLHAVHKSAVEMYLGVYQRLCGLRSCSARITNPYGPGQPASRQAYGVINRLIHLAVSGGTLTIYGDGLQLRDYVFIDDLTAALMLLGASAAADGRVYNVGSGRGTSLSEVAKTIVDLAGGGKIEHVEWPALAAQIETGDFVADISRIDRELGWRPEVTLRNGLSRTIASYRAHVPS